jgi:3-deoxy-D-manno-octulosonate 8-phosphate phosphatase (KDO 8-P phosphatase)
LTGVTAVKSRKKIVLFGMDVDGVLSDGGIYYGDSGLEIKRFHVRDGMGITMLRNAGVVPFIITARRSEATARRARELGIDEAHQGIRDKLSCLRDIAGRHNAALEEISFLGDDLADLPVLGAVGLPMAVGDAVEEVKAVAEYVTSLPGGHGAVREACERVLELNGRGKAFYRLSGYRPVDEDEQA